jgi:hypothetical protein
MKQIEAGMIAAAAALLAACGGGDGTQANNEAEAAVNDAAPAPLAENAAVPTAAAAASDPAAQYMVGKWSAMAEDCADTLDFRNDGKVTTPIGDANWMIAGDKLTIDYGDGSKPTTSTIKQLSADRIEVTTASGRKETQKRC